MRVLDVVAKDVYIQLEIPLKEIEMIKFLMDRATIDYDSKVPVEAEAVDYLHKKFYPFLTDTIKMVKGDGSGT